MTRTRALAVSFLISAPALAQPGNLLGAGRFDSAADVAAWEVVSPAFSSLVFEGTPDADLCDGSGNALATSNPAGDAGTAEYRICLGPVVADASYRIRGEILFPSSAVDGHANLTLSFLNGPNCTGTYDLHLFAGYAFSTVAGWQTVAAGPIVPLETSQSAMLRLLLTQDTGSQPAILARFDELRVTMTNPVFGDDFELGEACRWSAVQP